MFPAITVRIHYYLCVASSSTVHVLYVSTGECAWACDCACVWSRSAGSKDLRLTGQGGRKQDMAALNFEKSEKERVTRPNTYTGQGVLAWGHTRGQTSINRCNTHLGLTIHVRANMHREGRESKLKSSLQLLLPWFFFPIPPGSTFGQATCQSQPEL